MRYFTDQELEQAIRKAPKPVQEMVSSGVDVAVIIAEIGKKRGLHLEQIGIVAELNRNMLLGLVSPEEFLGELIIAKVSDTDAKQIMSEINQKIFIPLRAKMQGGQGGPEKVAPPLSAQPVPVVAPAPVPAPTPARTAPQAPAYTYAPPSTVIPANPSLPPRPQQVADSMMRYTPPPRSSSAPRHVPPARPFAAAPVARPAAAPVTEASHLLEDHEEPSPLFKQNPSINQPKTFQPTGQPYRPPQQTYRPPANLPGAMPPRVTERAVVPAPRPPSVGHYSSDPYREPVDESSPA